MTVYVTRHAQPVPPGDFDGAQGQDRPLTSLGRRQADRIGNRLADEAEFTGTVYASPFHRCLETADRICERTGTDFHPEPALAEVGGDWLDSFEGVRGAEIRERYECCGVIDDSLDGTWWPTASESGDDIETRVKTFLTATLAESVDDVLLVGHGATTGAIVRVLCGTDVESTLTGSAGYKLHYNATLTAIEGGEEPSLVLGNDTAHLDPGEITSNSRSIDAE